MTERTRKWLVYLTLPVAITWAAFNFPTGKSESAAVEESSIIAPVSAPVAKRPGADLINIKERQAAAWGADPFRRHQPQTSPHW